MPRIDFYILADNSKTARLQLACQLTEKAYKNKHKIYVHTQSQTQAHELDELLWTYKDDSFLPHNLYGEGPDFAPPIQIGFDVKPERHQDLLLTLSDEVPAFYQQFARILEVVTQDETITQLARARFKFYKSQGHAIHTHKLTTLA